jgi:hypothetical protein
VKDYRTSVGYSSKSDHATVDRAIVDIRGSPLRMSEVLAQNARSGINNLIP